ncbi:ATP-binding protein involved in chromosome partitioning [Thermotomaculum hydrothermale]|uniref:Iron-sulfur cluster carrier protein n=1 Tax=Thermotomaculum hydrothermale TaxID=981385 RepID=A0A7R6SZ63_9BACT|nr:P-loop NTPase [Thermotomaculum hydrothermale]BBB33524.1 ATP-binding protein involved in chromosome partitioning [Thermotomaculum hydrothermale]
MANSCSTGSCGANQNQDFERMIKDAQIQETLSKIKNKVVVLSGKGGVGKSTVAAGIAVSLAMEGYQVGLMDVDVHGPTIPNLFGLTNARPGLSPAEKLVPLKVLPNLKLISIGFLLQSQKDALIWRGPLKIGLIEQFIYDVEWENLDYLIVDCPPGTGDEPLTIFQLMKDAQAILVTTPQNVSVIDVEKSVTFCEKMGVKITGIIENMAKLKCPECGKEIKIFPGRGGEKIAEDFNLKLLASLPLSHSLIEKADKGELHKAVKELEMLKPVIEGIIEETKARDLKLDKRIIKIAIPLDENDKPSAHFGHAPKFAFVTADREKKVVVSREDKTPPPHEPNVIPQWLADNEADVLLTGGIGPKAETILNNNKVVVIKGVTGDNIEKIVTDYLNGSLQTQENMCDH